MVAKKCAVEVRWGEVGAAWYVFSLAVAPPRGKRGNETTSVLVANAVHGPRGWSGQSGIARRLTASIVLAKAGGHEVACSPLPAYFRMFPLVIQGPRAAMRDRLHSARNDFPLAYS